VRSFVNSSEAPGKFWNIELTGNSYITTSGKVGTNGRRHQKSCADEDTARAEHDRAIAKKLREGYHETTPQQPPRQPTPASATLLGLEQALVKNPDDLAAHRAHADYLHEQGDPRGDLIQVQLALEKDDLPEAERHLLKTREKRLLQQTEEACLGPELLALRARRIAALDWCCYQFDHALRRGWLHSLVLKGVLDATLARTLALAPPTRLLRELIVHYRNYEGYPELPPPSLDEALDWLKRLTHLKAVHFLGDEMLFDEDGRGGQVAPGFLSQQSRQLTFNTRHELFQAGDSFWDFIAALPELEELYLTAVTRNTRRLFGLTTLTHLRILQLNLTDDYPVAVLAANPALMNLTHLSFHPLPNRQGPNPYLTREHLAALAGSPNLPALTHLRFQRSSAGDEGVRVLLDSGLLPQLEFLDLAMGTITDAGADLLAGANLPRLKVLDLSRNALSRGGVQRLRSALGKKLELRVDHQEGGNHPEWLYEGECE
jgi:uncharacterized protein (TIGR02996 family)